MEAANEPCPTCGATAGKGLRSFFCSDLWHGDWQQIGFNKELQSLRDQLAAKDAEITHLKGGYQAANDVLKEKEKENAELRKQIEWKDVQIRDLRESNKDNAPF
jgi:DNA repair exonuclease SbcCD ATPase subunit